VTTEQVLKALRNVDFPASKEELIQVAIRAGAPEEVIHALRAIPPEQYASRAEVARSVPVDIAEELGLSPAQVAEQAREQHRYGPQHLSQYMREAPKPPVAEELEKPATDLDEW
jgi:hypothetical protein